MPEEWRPHDPWSEEQARTCFCGWSGFIEGSACPACACPLLPKVLRGRAQVVRSAFDYQKEFMDRRAARRARRADG